MVYLNQKIVAYLAVNNIAYTASDYTVTQQGNNPSKIAYWNTQTLGSEPTEAQLDSSYVIYEGQQIAAQNKENATSLLQQTDWTCTVDITNPEYSNPYLTNQNEFLAYRSTVRQIAVNPPTTPAVFPPKPDEIWSAE